MLRRFGFPILLCCIAAVLPLSTSADVPALGHASIFGVEPPRVPSHLRLPRRPAGKPPHPLLNQGLVRVAYSDPASGIYLGSPAITRLNADTLMISHDYFPEWNKPKATVVVASRDGGHTWQRRALVDGMYWASLFMHQGALYLLGTDDAYNWRNSVNIARSLDGGFTWDRSTVLAPPQGCQFGTGAVPVLLEAGRLWRGIEYWCGTLRWPQDYHALLIHASAAANLMDPASWQVSQAVQFNSSTMIPAWMPRPVVSGGYLEGNAVRLPFGGGVGLLLRCRVYDGQGRMYSLQQACLFKLGPGPALKQGAAAKHGLQLAARGDVPPHQLERAQQSRQEAPLSRSEKAQSLQDVWVAAAGAAPPRPLLWQGFVDLPGGGNKFQVRYDPLSRSYLALTNPSIDRYGSNSDARNILVLAHSLNLVDWRIAKTLLVPNDGLSWEQSLWYTGYQYADWVIDGPNLLAAIRTSYDGANSFHNSNQITFLRIEGFRQYLPAPAAS